MAVRERAEKGEERGAERTCIVSRLKGPPGAMLRFALSGEGVVVPDILSKLPGRGVWTQLDRTVVKQAVVKQAFSRGFRAGVKVGPELAEDIDRLLAADALRFLSLVNKAGLVVAGKAKVAAAIRAGAVVALIQATNGSADGASKLERLLKGRLGERAAAVARINLFGSSQLDLALGRTNVIHAALNAGPASAAFLAKAARLTLYRSGALPVAATRAIADTSQPRLGVTGRTHDRYE